MTDSDHDRRRVEALTSLVRRAPIYRAISGPTALTGGLLSLGGFATAYYAKHHRHHPLTSGEFRIVWLVILALTVLANLVFLWRGMGPRRGPMLSPAARLALCSMAPAFIAGGILTFMLHHPIYLAVAWLSLYGLALLSTQPFAPRSLVLLGGLFLAAGGVIYATWHHLFVPFGRVEPSALVVSGILAATFGGFHLAYAAAVWALGEGKTEPPAAT
jgi:hypothetical protein